MSCFIEPFLVSSHIYYLWPLHTKPSTSIVLEMIKRPLVHFLLHVHVPAVTGWETGYALDRSPDCHGTLIKLQVLFAVGHSHVTMSLIISRDFKINTYSNEHTWGWLFKYWKWCIKLWCIYLIVCISRACIEDTNTNILRTFLLFERKLVNNQNCFFGLWILRLFSRTTNRNMKCT